MEPSSVVDTKFSGEYIAFILGQKPLSLQTLYLHTPPHLNLEERNT
jgi:hypothetical protein